jgi:hypothetical protein
MTTLTKRESRRAAGSSVETGLQASHKYSTGANRCHACLTPCRSGWAYCDHCHAWSDLWYGIHPGDLGIDQARLDRARAYFAGRRPRESVESLVWKLMRRVSELEYEMSFQ